MRPAKFRQSIFFLCFGVLSICASRPAVGQSAASSPPLTFQVQRDQRALDLLTGCRQALGAVPENSAWRATGLSTPARGQFEPSQISVVQKGVALQKTIREFRGKTSVVVVMGSESRVHLGEKTQRPTSNASRYPRPTFIPIHLCSVKALRDKLSVEYVGTETLSGLPAEHIAIYARAVDAKGNVSKSESDASRVDLYIDPTSLLPRKAVFLQYAVNSPSSTFHSEFVYADYRSVAGATLPYSVTERFSNQDIATTVWSEIANDTNIQDSDFKLGGTK